MQKLLPKKTAQKKGSPPPALLPETNNLQRKEPNALKQVNFQTTKAKKLEMMAFAAERDISLTELLIRAFDDYKARNL